MLAVSALLCDYVMHKSLAYLRLSCAKTKCPHRPFAHDPSGRNLVRPEVKKLKVDNIPKILSCSKSYKIPSI